MIVKLQCDLGKLGQDSQEIARSLEMKGIKGKRNDSQYCPIALYLRDQGYACVSVGTSVVVAGACINSPMPIDKFIEDFDAGKYPQLEG